MVISIRPFSLSTAATALSRRFTITRRICSGSSIRWGISGAGRKSKLNPLVGILKKDDGIADDLVEIVQLEVGHRQPRIAGKFVDQILQHLDLIDDRLGAFMKDRIVLAQMIAVFFLQPLGGKLDGGQGILDLMGHPPRHLAPGGRPFRLLQSR